MENSKTVEFTPIEAISYCQNRLMEIPYTAKTQATVGAPIAEVVGILEQLKRAINSSEQPAEKKSAKKAAKGE